MAAVVVLELMVLVLVVEVLVVIVQELYQTCLQQTMQ